MQLPDPGRSRVALLATSAHTADSGLPDLPAVANNLGDLAAALSSPHHGWLTAEAQNTILNPDSAHDLAVRLTQLAQQAEDLLLVYYAGHGLLDQHGNLHLALPGTQRDYLRFTAFPFEALREAIAESPAKNRVLILDCCYSGRAIDAMADPDAPAYEQIDIAGTYTLTSTTATALALAPAGARHTVFTGELIRLLRDGTADAPDLLTLDHIYRHLRRRLVRAGHPRPQQRGTDTTPHLALVRNSALSASDLSGMPLEDQHLRPEPSEHETGVRSGTNFLQRFRLLSGANKHIGTSLDLQRTAEELVEFAVPDFADLATCDLLESVMHGDEPSALFTGQSALIRATAAAGDAELMPKVITPLGELAEVASTKLYTQCMHSQRPILVSHVDDESLRTIVLSQDREEPCRTAGVHSYLLVPVMARGRVFGAAEFVRVRNPEPFADADVALAEDLVAKAALCMDNVLLYRRERATALALQHSLLPKVLDRLPGLDVACRYLPSSASSVIAGDWFDVIPLHGGRVALVVGDVMGRGIRAAAMMGQLRSVARTLVTLALPPDQVLARLDEAVSGLGEEHLATCVCAIYDPNDQSCAIARAGHLPPVVVLPDGGSDVVELPPGLPLGIGGLAFESVQFTLPNYGILAMYTDGLVAQRGRSIDSGIDLLRETIAERKHTLEETCDAVLTALATGPIADDIAVILAQTLPFV